MEPAIILTRPQMGENIGAAARAMLNFGLTDLRLVAPRDGWPNPRAVATWPPGGGGAGAGPGAGLSDAGRAMARYRLRLCDHRPRARVDEARAGPGDRDD